MSKDPNEIVVGSNGEIYVAPEGTTLPTSVLSSLNGSFEEIGYTSEDGVTLNRSQTIEDIRVWQSRYPARRIVTDEVLSAGFAMRQWNRTTTELALGGEVSSLGGGVFKLTPLPADDAIDVRALVIDWHDGDKDYRLVVPRVVVSETGDIPIARNVASDLPVTLSVLAEEGGGSPWLIYTNDDAFATS
jgi:hypothetical protein